MDELSNLSAAQCASIAAITKNPTAYNPYTNPEQHLQRRNWILKLMHDQGKLTDAEYEAARTAPLVLAEEAEKEVVTHTSNNSYFTDAVFEAVTQQLMADRGLTQKEAHSLIYNGGLRIYATVNPFIQQEMEKIMLNADDAIPALWREEKVAAKTSAGEDVDPTTIENIVANEDGTYKPAPTPTAALCITAGSAPRPPCSPWTTRATCWRWWGGLAKRTRTWG